MERAGTKELDAGDLSPHALVDDVLEQLSDGDTFISGVSFHLKRFWEDVMMKEEALLSRFTGSELEICVECSWNHMLPILENIVTAIGAA